MDETGRPGEEKTQLEGTLANEGKKKKKISFIIRAINDVLQSPNNLHHWYGEDPKCALCSTRNSQTHPDRLYNQPHTRPVHLEQQLVVYKSSNFYHLTNIHQRRTEKAQPSSQTRSWTTDHGQRLEDALRHWPATNLFTRDHNHHLEAKLGALVPFTQVCLRDSEQSSESSGIIQWRSPRSCATQNWQWMDERMRGWRGSVAVSTFACFQRATFPKKQTEILTDSLNRYTKQAQHCQVKPACFPQILDWPSALFLFQFILMSVRRCACTAGGWVPLVLQLWRSSEAYSTLGGLLILLCTSSGHGKGSCGERTPQIDPLNMEGFSWDEVHDWILGPLRQIAPL